MREFMLGLRTAKYLVQREAFPGRYRRAVPDLDFVVNPKDYGGHMSDTTSAWRLKVGRTAILIVGQVLLTPLNSL